MGSILQFLFCIVNYFLPFFNFSCTYYEFLFIQSEYFVKNKAAGYANLFSMINPKPDIQNTLFFLKSL